MDFWRGGWLASGVSPPPSAGAASPAPNAPPPREASGEAVAAPPASPEVPASRRPPALESDSGVESPRALEPSRSSASARAHATRSRRLPAGTGSLTSEPTRPIRGHRPWCHAATAATTTSMRPRSANTSERRAGLEEGAHESTPEASPGAYASRLKSMFVPAARVRRPRRFHPRVCRPQRAGLRGASRRA
jgi:hypothetical protein